MKLKNNMARAFGLVVPMAADGSTYPPLLAAPNECIELTEAHFESAKPGLQAMLDKGDLEVVVETPKKGFGK